MNSVEISHRLEATHNINTKGSVYSEYYPEHLQTWKTSSPLTAKPNIITSETSGSWSSPRTLHPLWGDFHWLCLSLTERECRIPHSARRPQDSRSNPTPGHHQAWGKGRPSAQAVQTESGLGTAGAHPRPAESRHPGKVTQPASWGRTLPAPTTGLMWV